MSQYIDFYIKNENDKFDYLTSYGRSSMIYRGLAEQAPYERIKALTPSILKDAIARFNLLINNSEKSISYCETFIDKICTFPNSIEDKIDAISEQRSYIKDYEQEIDEMRYAINVYDFLQNIAENNTVNPLYFGIETYEPTMKDVIE